MDPGIMNQKANFTAMPNTSNQIPLSQPLSTGNYDVYTDANKCLKAKKANVLLSSNSTIILPTLKAGDLNNDDIINSLDWSSMNNKWFTNDPSSDLNKDGIVNSLDFSFINKNWLDES